MKDFLLIANKNCITFKEFFPFIKDRKVNIGYTHPGDFDQPDEDIPKSLQGLTRWFTTLSTSSKPPLVLTKTYDPEKYPKYDNYDAINVDKVKDIPWDYDGVMGVPITILDHNLDDVEIEGCFNNYTDPDPENGLIIGTPTKVSSTNSLFRGPAVNEKAKYFRILIKKNFEIVDLSRFLQDTRGMSKEFVDTYYSQGNTGQICEGHPDLCFYDKGKAVVPYMRILIKKNFEIEGLLGNFKEADCNETTGFLCGDDVSAYNLPGTQNGPVIITTKGPEAKYKRILIKTTNPRMSKTNN